jgi:hypothetical protein
MKQTQKLKAFWRQLRFKKFGFETTIFIIPCLFVLLGVLFLLPKIAYTTQIDAKALIKLTNEQRLKNGLPCLSYNNVLEKAAKNKANDLLSEGYFGHNSPDGKNFSDWVENLEYKYAYIGENLAMDFATNQGIIQGWMNSGKHKENILNESYKEIGIAVISGKFNGQKTTLVAQIFGAQLSEQENNEYLAINRAFLLPRFLSPNTFDIFIPKTKNKTIVRHNGIKKLNVLNSGHLKKYVDYDSAYWGEIDGKEFEFKRISITLLGEEHKSLSFYPLK